MIDVAALLIRHAVFPAWVRKNRSARLRYLRQLERTQFWSRDALWEFQWTRLKRLLTHAFEHCPFYRKKFAAAGLTPDDIRSPDDLSGLPTTSKREIQEYWPDLLADNTRRGALVRDMTGGSTGSPLVFYYDRDRLDSRAAATMRHDRWAGWDIGVRLALLWGAPRDTKGSGRQRLRDDLLGRRLVLDASAIDDARMRQFATKLRQYRPVIIQAYANTMALFARFVQAEGICDIRPRGIICSAEFLTEGSRAVIEETFKCPVFNRYGSREFAVIASECGAGSGMHINAENLFVEIFENGKSSAGKSGEILITDLASYAMPFIRYRTADVGRLRDDQCTCARGLPLIDLDGGRVTDFLVKPDGTKVSGIVVATYVITDIPGIRQIQFVQRQPGRVEVNLVKGAEWSERSLEVFRQRVRAFLGATMELDFVFRENIAIESSGKYRFSISTIQGQLG
jgi:phenylacetate-CoA ligase